MVKAFPENRHRNLGTRTGCALLRTRQTNAGFHPGHLRPHVPLGLPQHLLGHGIRIGTFTGADGQGQHGGKLVQHAQQILFFTLLSACEGVF